MWNRLNERSLLSCALVHSAKPVLGNSHISSQYFVVSLIYLDYMFLMLTENTFIGQSEIRFLKKKEGQGRTFCHHSTGEKTSFWSPHGELCLTVTGHHRLQGGQHTSKITIGYCTYIDSSRSKLPQIRPCQLTSSKVTLAVVRLSVWGKPKVSRVFKQRIQTEHLDYVNVPHGRVRNVDRRF